MAKKKEETTEELDPKEVRAAEEQILLTWLLSQLLANDLFNVAEPTIAKSARISYENQLKLSINTKQRKEAGKFMQEIKRVAGTYRQSSTEILGFINRSERYEKVIGHALEKMTEVSGEAIAEALKKYPK